MVCLCAKELRSGQTLRLWRDQLRERPPYRIDAGAAVRLLRRHRGVRLPLALGWPLPEKILDLSPAFRCVVNGREVPEGKGLARRTRLFRYQFHRGEAQGRMRKRIMQGWPFSSGGARTNLGRIA